MGSFIDKMKKFKKSLSDHARLNCEVNLGLRDKETGLSKDWTGHVIDRNYLEYQIERVENNIQNETDKEEKERLILELKYWKERLKNFDKEHGKTKEDGDRDL